MLMLNIVKRTYSIENKAILVLIMLSLLTGIFSSSAQAEKNKLYPRQINLSGNVFHFSMPEDFSKDMPANDMVEALDISDFSKFDNPEYGNLMRRWWDIKEPGWFGKNLGTVMIDISVQKVVGNNKNFIVAGAYDIRKRLDFMLMLNESFHQRYDSINKELKPEQGRTLAYSSGLLTLSDGKIYSLYYDKIYYGQKWINYAIAGPQGTTLVVFALPVSNQLYLEVVFTYSPNDGISPRQLGDVAHTKMAAIENSFRMDYTTGNIFSKIVAEDWTQKTNTEVLEEHRDTILTHYGINLLNN